MKMLFRKPRKVMMIIFLIILGVLLAGLVLWLSNPLLRSEETIRERVLADVPMGSSMEHVLSVAEESEDWIVRAVRENSGVIFSARTPTRPVDFLPGDLVDEIIIGVQSLRIHLGASQFILVFHVSAYFAFDENDELIDVFIRREWDVL